MLITLDNIGMWRLSLENISNNHGSLNFSFYDCILNAIDDYEHGNIKEIQVTIEEYKDLLYAKQRYEYQQKFTKGE